MPSFILLYMHFVAYEKMRLEKDSPDPTWVMLGESWSDRHNTRIKQEQFNMSILITIVMDKTNYRFVAQLSHIVAKLSLCWRVGP